MSKPFVVSILQKIITQYDLIFIQEIRGLLIFLTCFLPAVHNFSLDSSDTAIHNLLDVANQNITNANEKYAMVLSERLGQSNSKEQYAYFYRQDKIEIIGTYQYPDMINFQRPPYAILLQLKNAPSGVPFFEKSLFIMGCHISPTSAVAELNSMYDAFQFFSNFSNVTLEQQKVIRNRTLLMGDFNAGCTYVRNSDWPNIKLRTDGNFTFLISDSADTTSATTTTCAYDRFVAVNSIANQLINPSIFDFGTAYNLTASNVSQVSDHFPIFVTFQAQSSFLSASSSPFPSASPLSLLFVIYCILLLTN